MLFPDDSEEDPTHIKRVKATGLRAHLRGARRHIDRLLDHGQELPSLVEQVGGILNRYREQVTEATEGVNPKMLSLASASLGLVASYLKDLRRGCDNLEAQFEADQPMDALETELMGKAQTMHMEAGRLRIAFDSLHRALAGATHTDKTVFDELYKEVEVAATSMEGLAGRNESGPPGTDEGFRRSPK